MLEQISRPTTGDDKTYESYISSSHVVGLLICSSVLFVPYPILAAAIKSITRTVRVMLAKEL